MQHLRTRLADERGTAVVEFGMILPLVALLILGAVSLAGAGIVQMRLSNGVQEGIRTLALGGQNPNASIVAASGRANVVVTFGAATVNSATGAVTEDSVSSDVTALCRPTPPAGQPPVGVGQMVYVRAQSLYSSAVLPDVTLRYRSVMRCGG